MHQALRYWIHTYAERYRSAPDGRGAFVPTVQGVGWDLPVRTMPAGSADVRYDPDSECIYVGDGVVSGVSEQVWNYSVSGMKVLEKWLGYRTQKGSGRATSSSSQLDSIRPVEWHDQWNDELLDLVRILTLTVERQSDLNELLTEICEGPLIPAEALPQPKAAEREVPNDNTTPLFD